MATSSVYPTYPPHPGTEALRHPHWWQLRWVRYGALITLLAMSGLVILALVRKETGTEGFLVGLGLAVLPVPWLITAFRWLDRVAPFAWRNLVFAFCWGAFAAALIAIVANSFATKWIATSTADPAGANTLGATVIAPIVEESAKAAAVLLVFLFRRREFTGIVDGMVIAGITATGFAFTENILYLGTAFGTDQVTGGHGIVSVTAATFFVRIVMSPFAHPLFTTCTGIGFGLAAVYGSRGRARRVLIPLGGLLLAMCMHALWNGSAAFGQYGFLAVYGTFMLPVFGLLTWLGIWTRQRELRTVREELPTYVLAGWLGPAEPGALGSMRARRMARDYARHHAGRPTARAVAQYETYATALAQLRARGRRGRAGADFAARERELLEQLWQRREAARPALEYAARRAAPAPVPQGWAPAPYGHAYVRGPGHGYGPGYGYPQGPGHGYAQGPGPQPAQGPGPGYGYPAAPYPSYNPYRM